MAVIRLNIIRLSKINRNPIWFALKQLENNRDDGPWDFYQNFHLEASGFSFRSNLNFEDLLLDEFLADLQDSGVKLI